MFIAHLPAGYIGACAIEHCVAREAPAIRLWVFRLFIIGSMLPDVDVFYFYIVDHCAHHHHRYWTHLPFFWIAFYVIALVTAIVSRSRALALFATSLAAGILFHLILDTPMGGLAWFYPYSDNLIYLTTVPAQYNWWVWNFILHWTFISELIVCCIAGALYFYRNERKTTQA